MQPMKTLFACALVAATGFGMATAQIPYSEDFEGTLDTSAWDTATSGTAFERPGTSDFTAETSDVDWRGTTINPPVGGGSQFGKLTFDSPGFATVWRLLGTTTDTDYTVEADIYVPLVNSDPEPDDFLYQMIVVSNNDTGYARAHFQFNESAGTPDPRIRVQTTWGGFQTPFEEDIANITGLSATEGWKNLRVEADHTNNEMTITVTDEGGTPVVLSGGAITGLATGFSDGGQFGIAMYVDGEDDPAANGIDGQRSLYVDNFNAYVLGSSVDEWAVYQ